MTQDERRQEAARLSAGGPPRDFENLKDYFSAAVRRTVQVILNRVVAVGACGNLVGKVVIDDARA